MKRDAKFRSITMQDMLRIPAYEISDADSLIREPRVSVVLMTRNHESYLRQSVESTLAQRCSFPFEILIGEDHSSDKTREVCKALQIAHPDRIRLIVADRNVGITPNFLRLVVRCRGEYVALLEGDDFWTDPQKLQKQVALMDDHAQFAWCGARTGNRTTCLNPKLAYSLEETLRRYIVHTSTVMFRRRHISTYPQFPDLPGWISMVYAYLATKGECGFIDEEFSCYRHHSGGVWTGADFREKYSLSRIFVDTMNSYFESRYCRELADRELWIVRLHLEGLLGSWRFTLWVQSLQVIPTLIRRTARLQPFSAGRTVFSLLGAPLRSLVRATRRKAAIRSRIRKLFENAGT